MNKINNIVHKVATMFNQWRPAIFYREKGMPKTFERVGIILTLNFMKKSQVFIALGAFALAIGSFVAGKAAKKFAGQDIYFQASAGNCKLIASSLIFQTTSTGSTGITFYTSGGNAVAVYTANSGGTCQNLVTNFVRLQ